MLAHPTFKVVALCVLSLSLFVGVFAVQAQRRKRPSRRTTHPVSPTYVPAPSPTPASTDPRLVSSAEDQAPEDAGSARRARNTRQSPDQDTTNKAVQQLSTQITQLNKKVGDLEKQRRTDLIQERLTRAEQRVESLQTQMTDVMEKQANLQARVDQLDEMMKPENLDRQLATSGTFRPDEARDALRHQLDNEKKRVSAQLEVQNTRRQQLEKSLADAEQLAQRLRTELDDAMRREAEGNDGGAGGTSNPPPLSPNPTATPMPTPTPPNSKDEG
jgi:hypothetical protein